MGKALRDTYVPQPRTVKVQWLSLLSPGTRKLSALVSLVDILIVTSSSSRDVSKKKTGGASAFRAYLPSQCELIIMYQQQHDYDEKST